MKCASKIEFKFELNELAEFDNCKLNRHQKIYLLHQIEGRLEIIVDDNLFLVEDYFPVAELALSLKNWNSTEGFKFNTISHDKDDIFQLSHLGNTEIQIYSIWAFEPHRCRISIPSKLVHEAIATFITQLEHAIYEKWRLTLRV